MSRYPIVKSGPHPTEFILTEANGQRSRDNAYFVDPTTVQVGQPCKKTADATTDTPATYVLATVGADCKALTLYGGTSMSGEGLHVSVITRDCEVNGRCINWGSLSQAEQVAGVAALATVGIIVRI